MICIKIKLNNKVLNWFCEIYTSSYVTGVWIKYGEFETELSARKAMKMCHVLHKNLLKIFNRPSSKDLKLKS